MKLLYVTDRAAVGDARFAEILDALADSPNLTVELREKTIPDRKYLAVAAAARARLAPSVPLYVNRRFDIAIAAGASGVHLPADGIPPGRVRANTPRGFRVGVSTHSAEEATGAIAAGADLVVIGPIFDTPSKREFGPPLGTAELGRLPDRGSHGCEVFAIGGMDLGRLTELEGHRDRIAGIAAVRLLQESPDPRAVAEEVAAR
jgi:thiamine-phosphate pyrophosphorylase